MMSGNQSPQRRNSNPFSERISSLLQLRTQIAQQQQALSDKINQDLQRLDAIAPRVTSNNSLRQIFSEMDGVEVYDPSKPNPIPDFDMNNIDLYCEPECPFDVERDLESESSGFDVDHNESDNKSYVSAASESDDEDSLANNFAVSVNIYDQVSYNNFNFDKWLKMFDLICIKEILVFHGLQLKDSWTLENFNNIFNHPLIKRDNKLLSKIESMLNVFNSLKRKELTGKGVWENDTDNDTDNDNPSFINAIIQRHFENVNSNLVQFKGLTFELNKMPQIPSISSLSSSKLNIKVKHIKNYKE